MSPSFQTKLNDWLVPVVLGAMVYYMQSMARDFHDISVNMAVALERIEEGSKRIAALEKWREESSHFTPGYSDGRSDGGLRPVRGHP